MASEPSAPPPGPPPKKLALHWRILLGLVVGAVLGLAANAIASRPVTPGVADPQDADRNGVHDRLDWWAGNVADPLGRVFIRLILMVVLPLVFSALALGVIEIGEVRRLGRVGLKTLALTAGLSLSAVVIGIGLVNLVQPGRMLPQEKRAALRAEYLEPTRSPDGEAARPGPVQPPKSKPLKDVLLDIIPENPLQEMVGAVDGSSKGNGMLAVMFFALVFGIAVTQTPDRARPLVDLLEGLQAVTMVVIRVAMRLAPLGVACLVFSMTARLGLALVAPLLGFVATVVAGLGLQLLVVYPLVLWWFGRIPPGQFFRGVSEAMLTAFGTSSSNATLPTSLRVAQENLGLPRDVSSFVLTIGATGNQNGTALFEGVVILFLAQVFQVDLTLVEQATVLLMSVLAGIGTAGVPGGSIPLIVVVLQSVGVPGEGIGVVLGVDRLLDMCRTVVNVTGDLAVAACVSGTGRADER